MSEPLPQDESRRPPGGDTPDYAKRQAAALAALVVIALAAWGVVSAAGGGGHGHSRASAATTPGSGQSVLDALAPDLQQNSGGTLSGAHVSLPVGRAISQLFLVGFAGTDAHAPIFARLRAHDWGGVVLDRGNFTSTHQLAALVASLRTAVKSDGHTPPLVAVRQAGGDQSALPGLPPSAQPAQGATPAAALGQALAAGRALRGLRIDMNLAPDADLAYQGGAAGSRAFGADPATVGRLSVAAVAGYRRAGVVAVLGHFPGEGAASADPQSATATVGLSPSDLRSRDLQPFAAAAGSTPAIQVSDALFNAIDPVVPASLSPAAYSLLRGTLHYRGVAVSGDLVAAAGDSGVSVGDAAVSALRAGADLLYVSGGPANEEQAYSAVVLALRTGRLSSSQVAAAVGRDLALKRSYGLIPR